MSGLAGTQAGAGRPPMPYPRHMMPLTRLEKASAS